jgi:hypothetical protein
MTPEITDLAASVHQRLLNRSKALDLDFNLLLARYAIERFLYRLAQSPYADQFVLKGAMLLQIWLPEAGRPTRDLDLLGFGDMTPDRLRRILAAVCDQPVSADGCHTRHLRASQHRHPIRPARRVDPGVRTKPGQGPAVEGVSRKKPYRECHGGLCHSDPIQRRFPRACARRCPRRIGISDDLASRRPLATGAEWMRAHAGARDPAHPERVWRTLGEKKGSW